MTEYQLLDPGTLAGRAARDLDWDLLLDRLGGMTTSEAAGRRLRARGLEDDWQAAHDSMTRTAECLSLADEALSIPTEAFPDLGNLVDHLERGAVASGTELRDLGRMLLFARALRTFASDQAKARPALAAWITSNPCIDPLGERLRRSLDDDGVLEDDASPALGRARARVKQARQLLVSELKRLIQTHSDILRDEYYSERDGRYVIPVRADAHRAIDGVVLDTSASGNTLFVEPRELTRYSNDLRVAESEVIHEEQRLLRELSESARRMAPELREAETACIEADILGALARWAKHTDAVALLPEREPVIALRSVRHPLLVGRVEVVPNDLTLSAGCALVLSGPNAGGKTVALKCLGLVARMARAGIPICAEANSRIGFFSSVFTEIGDAQSIVTSLSTFSAHVLVLASILAHAGEGSLVLLDEVAAGTDPEQGAALAAAYLEALVEGRATVAATTHYESLKELANSDPHFHNAAVGFDIHTMMPTFRIVDGVAGPSTALAVAARYGIRETVIERAQTRIPDASRKRERLLEDLATERTLAERLRLEAERDAAEQRRLRLALEAETEGLRANFDRQLEQEYRELLGQLRVARTQLETVRQRLKNAPSDKQSLGRLEREIDAAAHSISLESAVADAVRSRKSDGRTGWSALPVEGLGAGQRAHVARLGTDVELLDAPRKGNVRVRAGNVTLTVAVSELSKAGTKPGAQGSPLRNRSRAKAERRESQLATSARTAPARMVDNTLDLRGERVVDALARVEAFVDELLRRGEPAGYVLHGHGTGALKQAVREHLGGVRAVVDSGPAGPEDGGDAFTLFWLER